MQKKKSRPSLFLNFKEAGLITTNFSTLMIKYSTFSAKIIQSLYMKPLWLKEVPWQVFIYPMAVPIGALLVIRKCLL